jgi:hypothetical protein
VKDVVSPNGEWNFDLIKHLIPNSVIQKMYAIIPPNASQEDAPLWPGTNSG